MSKVKTVGIIGAGVAGLAAGGLLSKRGLRVKLFEANGKIGGCCANTVLDGYTFNDGALYLVLPQLLDHALRKLDLDRSSLLPLRKIRAAQRTVLPDGTVVCIGDGLEVTVQKRQGSVNGNRLQQELQDMMQRWEPLLHLFTDDFLIRPFSVPRLVSKGWRHLPQLRGTVAGELNRLFSDEAVRGAMSATLLFAGLPPHSMPVTSIIGLVAMLSDGYYLPEGGMGKITQVLDQSLRGYGGEIFLNSKVRRIVMKEGRVTGLEVDGHDSVEVDAVISTVSGMVTYSSLLSPEQVPIGMKRKVQQAPLSHKAFCLQLGLSNRIDATSHSNSIVPFMENQDQVFASKGDEIRYPIYSVPTVTAPELAPRGGSVIEMYPSIRQEMPAAAWSEQEKEHVVQLGIRALSRLHKLEIAVTRVFSPKDFQDRLHLYHGAVYGLSPVADPTAYFPHRTRIPRLYQAGQTTWPGYGVSPSAISGILAAEALLQTAMKDR